MKRALITACLVLSAGAAALAQDPAGFFDETSGERIVEVKTGGTIELRLNENPATGFSWSLESLDPRFFQVVFDDFDTEKGLRILKIKCLKAGGRDLKLAYVKSWEANKPPARTFRLMLTVI